MPTNDTGADISRSVLVVVDMQNDFLHKDGNFPNPTSTVRVCNWLINKEKLRFEAGCGAKWRICANLLVYNSLN